MSLRAHLRQADFPEGAKGGLQAWRVATSCVVGHCVILLRAVARGGQVDHALQGGISVFADEGSRRNLHGRTMSLCS